jgi:hypothetical protein
MDGDVPQAATLLVPVLTVPDAWLFPLCSLALTLTSDSARRSAEMAARAGGFLLIATQKEPPAVRELHAMGTLAAVDSAGLGPGVPRLKVEGLRRARIVTLMVATPLVAEIELLEDEDPGDHWGPAVEALARYLHGHPPLRALLDERRSSSDPMAWINLACQHLPIAASARQKLLEASPTERCQRIGRGLDALLRKEHGP